MADVIDPGAIFGKVKSLRDANVENTLKNQAMQEGDLKNSNTANLYRTQVLTGAVASGDQKIYDAAKQHLSEKGIDTSDLAPDLATGAAQIQAMRQAQYNANPLNAMLGLGLKAESNLTGATTAMGDAAHGAQLNPLSAAIAAKMANGGVGGVPGGGAAPAALPPSPAAPTPAAAPGAMPDADAAFAKLPVTQGLKQGQPLPATEGAPQPEQRAAPQIPQRLAGETQAAYENRPDVIFAKEQAKSAGTEAGKLPSKAINADETFGRINQNLQAMLAVNPSVPYSHNLMNSGFRAFMSQQFGGIPILGDNQETANAYNAFSKVNKAQVLNGIQELVQSGAIRSNQALIRLVDHVNSIDENATPESRAQQIQAVSAELQNLATSANNVDARINGGEVKPYQAIPMTTGKTDGGWSYGGTVK